MKLFGFMLGAVLASQEYKHEVKFVPGSITKAFFSCVTEKPVREKGHMLRVPEVATPEFLSPAQMSVSALYSKECQGLQNSILWSVIPMKEYPIPLIFVGAAISSKGSIGFL